MTTPGVSRRSFLRGGAAVVGGTALGAAAVVAARSDGESASAEVPDTVDFHGPHQAGIDTVPQAWATFVALDLRKSVGQEGLGRLLRLWSDDAARLTQGIGALADLEPELAVPPARLTVTFGLGAALFDALGMTGQRPVGLVDLPPLPMDRLEQAWSGGDLLVHVGGDDPTSVAHAVRMLLKDGRAFATVRWTQRGFRNGPSSPSGSPHRNLLGQVDGTANPIPGSPEFSRAVWIDEPGWFRGGTIMVVRRIRMDLDRWDDLDRGSREQVIGRRLADGAPLTGGTVDTPLDLAAVGPDGLPVIADFAHARRAHATTPDEVFLRRGYSYDEPSAGDAISDSGLIFCAYQADVGRQFLPVQRRLAELDLLNQWTTPIGSAVFAIPPGCAPGGWVGEGLLA